MPRAYVLAVPEEHCAKLATQSSLDASAMFAVKFQCCLPFCFPEVALRRIKPATFQALHIIPSINSGLRDNRYFYNPGPLARVARWLSEIYFINSNLQFPRLVQPKCLLSARFVAKPTFLLDFSYSSTNCLVSNYTQPIRPLICQPSGICQSLSLSVPILELITRMHRLDPINVILTYVAIVIALFFFLH